MADSAPVTQGSPAPAGKPGHHWPLDGLHGVAAIFGVAAEQYSGLQQLFYRTEPGDLKQFLRWPEPV